MCSSFEKPIARYLNGELPAVETRRLEMHLSLCEPCRRAVDSQRSSFGMPSRVLAEELTMSDLRSRLMEDFETAEVLKQSRFNLSALSSSWWVYAAAVVVVVVAGYAALSHL